MGTIRTIVYTHTRTYINKWWVKNKKIKKHTHTYICLGAHAGVNHITHKPTVATVEPYYYWPNTEIIAISSRLATVHLDISSPRSACVNYVYFNIIHTHKHTGTRIYIDLWDDYIYADGFFCNLYTHTHTITANYLLLFKIIMIYTYKYMIINSVVGEPKWNAYN